MNVEYYSNHSRAVLYITQCNNNVEYNWKFMQFTFKVLCVILSNLQSVINLFS